MVLGIPPGRQGREGKKQCNQDAYLCRAHHDRGNTHRCPGIGIRKPGVQWDDRQFHPVPEQDQDGCKDYKRRVCTGKGFGEF